MFNKNLLLMTLLLIQQCTFIIYGITVTVEKCEFLQHDQKVLLNPVVRCAAINETTMAENITLHFPKPLNAGASADIQFYVLFGKQYRLSPIRMNKKVSEILELKQFDLENLFLKYYKPPLTWPLKGTYVATNYVPDASKFPALPAGSYKINMQFKQNNKPFAVYNHYMKVGN